MGTTSIRLLGLVGLVGVTALVAAPLTAMGAESDSPTAVVAASRPASGPDLTNDYRTVPAVEKLERKHGRKLMAERAASGVHTVDVSVVTVTSATDDDTNSGLTLQNVTAAIAAVNDYWNEESAGAVSVVLGEFEEKSLGQQSGTCDVDAVDADNTATAFDGKYANYSWIGTGDHLLTLTAEGEACSSSAAFASLGGDGGTIFSASGIDSTGIPVLFHEFGHNLGFGHANAAVCRSSSIDSPKSSYKFETAAPSGTGVIPTTRTCPVEEYGDYLDIMGYSVEDRAPHASSVERSLAGWLAVTKPAIGKKSTIVLRPLDNTTGTRAIRIADSRTGDVYFVEFRTPAGRDGSSVEFFNSTPNTLYRTRYSGGYAYGYASGDAASGIVRVLRVLNLYGDADESTVLGVTPVSADGKTRLNSMQAGDSFVTSGGGTKITVNSISAGSSASVSITTAKGATTTTAKPATSSIKKNKTSKLAIRVKAVTTSKPTGTVTVYAKGKKLKTYTLSSARSGTITVTLPKFSKKGSYSLKVKYSGSSTVASSTSKSVTLKVK